MTTKRPFSSLIEESESNDGPNFVSTTSTFRAKLLPEKRKEVTVERQSTPTPTTTAVANTNNKKRRKKKVCFSDEVPGGDEGSERVKSRYGGWGLVEVYYVDRKSRDPSAFSPRINITHSHDDNEAGGASTL